MRMLDGFNEGWIDFKADRGNRTRGTTPLEQVIEALVRQATASGTA
ncbi:hypothetical protein QFZ34_001277 [Phyllobacterium ifriqiyense]|uniref:Uncharacterized protein n=1 Tax=Phyllobacterium ifriqiyense TaxID=314238 RepID=A0ABU0S824_9HYPH|nr:hypothetical protein [Phyllobacterium ifriqiyense]